MNEDTPVINAAAQRVDEMCVGMSGFMEFVSAARILERQVADRDAAIARLRETLSFALIRLEHDTPMQASLAREDLRAALNQE